MDQKEKNLILQSRLNAGRAISQAVQKANNKPPLLIQTSGIGYYGDRGDELLDESSSAGTGFLADVAIQWERSVQPLESLGLRIATIRLGVVLGPHGGVIARLIPPFRFFLGGHPGSGKQWFPWIHIDDVVAVIRFLMENPDCAGPFNLTHPNPILSKDFYTLLGKAMHRPAFFPMPAFALKLVLGEMASEMLLPSIKAVPQKLLEAGYKFKFPDLSAAIENIFQKNS
ncbi:MAG: TIGR01777 family protein [Planctomycetes bacterium]|nr:TIGR01777 family protein [Planctomycetota bacterium]